MLKKLIISCFISIFMSVSVLAETPELSCNEKIKKISDTRRNLLYKYESNVEKLKSNLRKNLEENFRQYEALSEPCKLENIKAEEIRREKAAKETTEVLDSPFDFPSESVTDAALLPKILDKRERFPGKDANTTVIPSSAEKKTSAER
jgi:formiminotetrahydrofolate cyclodeaminase